MKLKLKEEYITNKRLKENESAMKENCENEIYNLKS